MAIEAGDFKTGLTLIVDGDPWQVIDFQHVKPGKGAAILRTKMKNLKTCTLVPQKNRLTFIVGNIIYAKEHKAFVFFAKIGRVQKIKLFHN